MGTLPRMGVMPRRRYRRSMPAVVLPPYEESSWRLPSSSTVTSRPAAANVAAVTAPPAPEPMTSTWVLARGAVSTSAPPARRARLVVVREQRGRLHGLHQAPEEHDFATRPRARPRAPALERKLTKTAQMAGPRRAAEERHAEAQHQLEARLQRFELPVHERRGLRQGFRIARSPRGDDQRLDQRVHEARRGCALRERRERRDLVQRKAAVVAGSARRARGAHHRG